MNFILNIILIQKKYVKYIYILAVKIILAKKKDLFYTLVYIFLTRKDVSMDYLDKKSVRDIEVREKTVFLRCDFNVPLDPNGNITDTRRIDESMKTIKYLVDNKAKLVLCSHLGRPKCEFTGSLSMAPVAKYLESITGKNIKLIPEITGENTKNIINEMSFGDICILENIRFAEGEKVNDPEFAKELASLADVYINDAFGACHREHASTAGIAKYLPSGYGFLIEKELSIINKVLANPKRPFVSILGGAKISDKIGVINSLLDKVDVLIVGGGMSYTFANALGYSVGTSLCETDKLDLAKDMMAKAKEKNVKFLLPLDIKVARKYDPNSEYKIVDFDKIPDGWMGLDIGPKTEKLFSDALSTAGTIIWNGPMGVSEWDNFASGTLALAKAIAKTNAVSIIGGGDSAAAVVKLGYADKMTHISTGGGASLCLLEGKELPAIKALENK